MYGMFAVRVIEDAVASASVDATAPLPQGHTTYSWRVDDAAARSGVERVPQGHTLYSWTPPGGTVPSSSTCPPEREVNRTLAAIVDQLSEVEEGQHELAFYSGNPRVHISRGRVHLYTRRRAGPAPVHGRQDGGWAHTGR